MKISVIVPVYNTRKYLARCVDSILAQSFCDFEVLLVDDGSTDGSGLLCDEYAARDNRIFVIHKANGGVPSARNAGLEQSKGEWIMHVDSDDFIEPNMLQSMLKEVEKNSADIVICDFRFIGKGINAVYHNTDWTDNREESLNNYIASVWTCIWGNLVKRSLYMKYNLRTPGQISYCEDFHLIIRLCFYADKIVRVNQPFYNYWQQTSSIVHNMNKRTEADEQWAYQDTINFFKEQDQWETYKKSMCWRMLKATQELVLDQKTWKDFLALAPEKKHFIRGCPFINRKLKLNMWCLSHGFPFISRLMLLARSCKKSLMKDC